MKKFLEAWSTMVNTVTEGSGRLSEALRAAAHRGQELPTGAFAAYAAKVRGRAYTVTDEDHAALRSAGLDDEQIYELTIASAVGAADERRAAFARLWASP